MLKKTKRLLTFMANSYMTYELFRKQTTKNIGNEKVSDCRRFDCCGVCFGKCQEERG